MKRLCLSIFGALIAVAPAHADEEAVAHLGDALAYVVACPGRLWYDRNVMWDYADLHKIDYAEGTADYAKVEARARMTTALLIARPMNEICLEGYLYYGIFGTKVPRFLTWW